MRILFLPLITRGPAIGTVSRCLAVAERLRKFGHECSFLASDSAAHHAAEAGFEVMEGAVPESPGPLRPLCDLSDLAVFLKLTDEEFVRVSLKSENQAVQRFRPDVLFSEFKLTAAITAAGAGLPLVSTACTPGDPRFVSPLFEKTPKDHAQAVAGFNRILEERDQEPINDTAELFFGRSDAKIAPTVPELEPLLSDVPNLHYVGYLLNDRMELAPLPEGLLGRCNGKFIVFVYLGQGEISSSLYMRVLPEAFKNTEFHAIVSVGDHPEVARFPKPESNVTWVRFVPGRSILRCSQAAIFHGGQNTAMASLIHKIPSLVFPGNDFERDFNARSLARVGASMRLSTEDFQPDKLLSFTRKLLEPSFGLAAETYSRKILGQGGARHAADIVLSAVNT
ncbi:MAG: hypothetical protein HY912_02000 [Desulfomonile tiedjei]|uniref:Erythromycin biosynthesis protein CIII-like C-terminal domain-containing protein n=1 Tax=Desulfomonile tiedjei TaxID=2358 RepID=A0A9D6UXQ8_9BACT|nr:hypothetical protein [Desulfomonile tiedjei]